MPEKKIISVVMPVFNAAPFLRQCLDSVLSQRGADLEALVVDNGSTDGSQDICEQYAKMDSRVRLFRMNNRGPGAARNFAFSRAVGDVAAFIDADDYFEPDALRILRTAWLESGAEFVRSENHIFADSIHPPPDPAAILLSGPPQGKMPRNGLIDIVHVDGKPRVRYWSPCGSSLVSTAVVKKRGIRFNETMGQGEDSWFMLELAKISVSYHYCDTVTYNWRRHGYNSITLTSLHPLERVACKFFFYARLREYLRSRFGESLANRALAHNYASVYMEMLILYGGWATGKNRRKALECISRAIADPLFLECLPDYMPPRARERTAKKLIRLGKPGALAILCRHLGRNAVKGWEDYSGFDDRRVVEADYTPPNATLSCV